MKNCPRGTSLQIPPPSFVIGHLSSYEAVRRSFETLFDRKDVRPGCVISIQTFGSYGANFNPHCHAIISDGVWTREGEFLELPSLDTAAVCELFRRLLLLGEWTDWGELTFTGRLGTQTPILDFHSLLELAAPVDQLDRRTREEGVDK